MFKSIDLCNFKCFSSLENPIPFSKVNLLTGSNGRGKSSVFQSILLLAQSYESGRDFRKIRLAGRFLELGAYRDIVFKGNIEQSITITLETDDDENNRMKFVCKAGSSDGFDTTVDNIYVGDTPLVSDAASIGLGNANEYSAGQKLYIPTSTYECFSQLSNVFFVSADRMGPRNIVKMLEEQIGDQIGIHGENVFNSLYERAEIFQKDVAAELSAILGGASVCLSRPDLEFIRINLDSVDNSKGYKPVNVGFGYSYIMPLVVLPMIAPEGSKIIIENPEAHLHPGAQSRLMDFLIRKANERKIQLFIETHSDHIIDGVRVAVKQCNLKCDEVNILFLERHQDNPPFVREISVDSYGNLSEWPEDFFDQALIDAGRLL